MTYLFSVSNPVRTLQHRLLDIASRDAVLAEVHTLHDLHELVDEQLVDLRQIFEALRHAFGAGR